MLVASDEATSGSVMQNAERISPSSSGRSHCARCCSVPNSASSSMLPVSGAAQFSASGASAGLRPVISASGAYWRLVSPAPSGWLARNRFHSPRLRASALSSATTGGRCHGNPDLAAAAVCSAKTGSAGKTCSAMKAEQPLTPFLRAAVVREVHGASRRVRSELYLPASIHGGRGFPGGPAHGPRSRAAHGRASHRSSACCPAAGRASRGVAVIADSSTIGSSSRLAIHPAKLTARDGQDLQDPP